MLQLTPKVKADAIRRLRRVEGQARGVQKMLEEDRDCHEILHQLTAIRSAAYQTSLMLARNFATQCLKESDGRSPEEMVDDLLSVFSNMPEIIVLADEA